MDDQVTVNEVEAGMNGERIQEQDSPLTQGVGTCDMREAELHERPTGLSPFKEDGSVRADDSWLNSGFSTSKKKKGQENDLAR